MEEESKTYYKRRCILTCQIEELYDHGGNDELYRLKKGDKVALVRHKGRQDDRNAVAVSLMDEYTGDPEQQDFDFNVLGYIPESCNSLIASMLDMGWEDHLEAEVIEIKRDKDDEDDEDDEEEDNDKEKDKEENEEANDDSQEAMVKLAVYIRNSEDEDDDPDQRVWALNYDVNDMATLIYHLHDEGFVLESSDILKSTDGSKPRYGDRVVVAYCGPKTITLYLMKCAIPLSEEVDNHNDPYLKRALLLCNLAGPITVYPEDVPCLQKELFDKKLSADLLSAHASAQLSLMFERYTMLPEKPLVEFMDAESKTKD